jgi:acyl-CoA synthetase (AMP-forming)/AMP-acid ligase II
MNIIEILRKHTASRPSAPAIIDSRRGRERAISFAELDRLSALTAALLREKGLRAGDTALVFHPMSAELYITLLALFRLGMTAMFLDPSAGRKHIERCCAMAEPQALIASVKAHALRLISPAVRRIPSKFVIGPALPGATSINLLNRSNRHSDRWGAMSDKPPDVAACRGSDQSPHPEAHDKLPRLEACRTFEIAPCAPDHAALLTFTSGSTGEPKAALRTHGFLLAQHRALEHSLALTAGEVDLTTLPIFVLANLASGVTSVIPDANLRFPGSIDPAPVMRQIRAHRPTSAAASPALLERLADHCLKTGDRLDSFKRIYTGGAPVFPRTLEILQAVAPQAEIVAVYGSTEAEPIAHIGRAEMMADDIAAMIGGRGLLAGTPVSEIRLRILRDQWGKPVGPFTTAEFKAACARTDEPGEIVVSGSHVLTGYWRGHGDREIKFKVDGEVWHRTGDAGYLDHAGRLWLLGRSEARVNDSRGALYPFAVECAASHHAGVRRAAIVAHEGRRLLVIEPSVEGRAVELTELRRSLAWARIDEMRWLKRIPVDRRHNAKIDYPGLRRLLDCRIRKGAGQ